MSEPGDQPELSVPPLSERVQAGARHLRGAVERLAHVGEPRMEPFEVTIDREQPELAKIDPDPGHMAGINVTGEPQPLARPSATEDHLTHTTPQFFLRNTGRLERITDPKRLDREWVILRELDWRDGKPPEHGMVRFEPASRVCVERIRPMSELVAQRRSLVVESQWSDQFGKPDPEALPPDNESD